MVIPKVFIEVKKYLNLSIFIFTAFIFSCSFQKKGTDKYIFLITLDTTRADCIDYSLVNNGLTPNLSKLAASGIQFQNAYSLIPITLPSHYSMFYSLPPHILKIYNNGQRNDVPHRSLAQLLKNKGYETGAVVSLASVGATWGLDKGFDEYIENYRKSYLSYKTAEEVNQDAFELIKEFKHKKFFLWVHYSDPHEPYFPPFYGGSFTVDVNEERKFVSKSTERSFFKIEFELFPGKNVITFITTVSDFMEKDKRIKINYNNYENFSLTTDAPAEDVEVFLPSEWKKKQTEKSTEYNSREKRSDIRVFNKTSRNINGKLKCSSRLIPTIPSIQFLYKEEIKYMDYHIGKLIEFLKEQGIFEKSIFIIMGDHGEGLGEYLGHVGHVDYLNKLYLKVPFIVCGHGIPKEEVRQNLVSNLNIAPTILEIVTIKKPDFMLGDSLFGELENKELLLETYSPEADMDSFAMIDYPYQLIYYPNRNSHRLEFYDLQRDSLGIDNIMKVEQESEKKRNLLKHLIHISGKILASKQGHSEISQKDKDILKSLGYLK